MQGFGERLRARAQALGLSDAEVARRSGLNERRYGHYVANRREPDLATLMAICRTLGTTPDDLLGVAGSPADAPERERLTGHLLSLANALDETDLRLAVRQVAVLVDLRSGGRGG